MYAFFYFTNISYMSCPTSSPFVITDEDYRLWSNKTVWSGTRRHQEGRTNLERQKERIMGVWKLFVQPIQKWKWCQKKKIDILWLQSYLNNLPPQKFFHPFLKWTYLETNYFRSYWHQRTFTLSKYRNVSYHLFYKPSYFHYISVDRNALGDLEELWRWSQKRSCWIQ